MYRSYRKQRQADIEKALKGWVFKTARDIERQAKHNVPKATGALGKAIKALLGFPTAVVAVMPKYGRFVEGYPKATKRHFVPFDKYPAFAAWARRRGHDTSRGGLLVWGYATKFFSKAIATVRPKAKAALSRLKLRR